jgi:hypothetical protein
MGISHERSKGHNRDLDEPYTPAPLVQHEVLLWVGLRIIIVGSFGVKRLFLVIDRRIHEWI